MSDKNTFIAILLSFIVIMTWGFFFPSAKAPLVKKTIVINKEYKPLTEEVRAPARVQISSDFLNGSINLQGLKIDDLLLNRYHETDKDKKNVRIFHPNGTNEAYFTEIGWVGNTSVPLPDANTVWHADKKNLTANNSINLTWNNDHGVDFIVKISLDEKYMFKIEQSVINNSSHDINLQSYSRLSKIYRDVSGGTFIVYEGPIAMLNKKLEEVSLKSLIKNDRKFNVEKNNNVEKGKRQNKWFGFSDKYWASILILNNELNGTTYFQHAKDKNNDNKFQIGYKDETESILKTNTNNNTTYHLFVGPKELSLLDSYEDKYSILLFDRVLDFGVLYFITKPILLTLNYIYNLIGNFGFAIIILTFIIRLITLPLSIKSFISMLKMKILQPQIQLLKERYKEDKMQLSKESTALFKKHSVKPLAGCLPTLLQVPIFFALYKVLLISIEMRHAEFIWWIHDLSMPDPTNVLNLLGLLSFNTPITIGILPILLSVTMVMQQRINTPNFGDKSQMMAMKLMPYIFIFIFASFPAGMVLYWIVSNTITITQQTALKQYFNRKNSLKTQ